MFLSAALAIGASTCFAQLPTMKVLTIDVANTIAQEAMLKCRADGYKVTVLVVDHANMMKALVRDDGALIASLQIAQMKTTTVIGFGRPSGPPANLPPGQPAPPPVLPGSTNAVGGVPIKIGDQLIGAVAVSGAPGGDKDVACANFALQKVADKLK